MKNYLILNTNKQIVAEANTAYEAARIANQKADFMRKTYYVFNVTYKTIKPYYGFNIYNNSINGYGRYR
jgi:hypothetical protein